ncbi:unnamed protein product [Paramecium sonneborni]|uniref:Cdc23 domain-containing protein n=1 Tax=Paramecium sonneborni TaxID=65129 RepID=A0A8S1PWK4_9CILI|nr:unnamed protein product [Paramecium sonneborni]
MENQEKKKCLKMRIQKQLQIQNKNYEIENYQNYKSQNIYLYGLIKIHQNLELSKQCLIQVLNQLPCFWSAWLELCRLMSEERFNQLDSKYLLQQIRI